MLVRVKWGVTECFKITSGVTQGCIMAPWLLNIYMDVEMKEVNMRTGAMGVRFLENDRE